MTLRFRLFLFGNSHKKNVKTEISVLFILRCFQDFLNDGLIEYLDVNEENDSLIAVYEKHISK